MKKRTCAVFIFDGFADQEVALTLAWLNGQRGFEIETFSYKGRSVTSMSGLRVTPHTALEDMDPADFDLLLLPGGEAWERGDNLEIFPLIQATFGRSPVAAICGATLALADLGFLNRVPHTSNFPGYVKHYCPEYEGEAFYQAVPCVNTGELITASGVAIIDFACEVLKTCGIYDGEKALSWRELYQSGGEAQSFYAR